MMMRRISLFAPVSVFFASMLIGVLTETPSAQTPPKVIELKLSSHKPPTSAPAAAFKEWAERVGKESGGRVKVNLYFASSLVANEDIIPGTERGICDIGDLVIHRERDKYPLTGLLALPFLNLGDPKTSLRIWAELEGKFPQMKAEHNRFKTVYRYTTSAGHLHTVKGPLRTPADVKGMKIIGSGHIARVLKDIGASPLALTVPEWYSAIDRGLAQGHFLHYYGTYETKIYERLRYHTDIGYGYGVLMEQLIMNSNSWGKLSPDIQKLFDELSPWLTQRVGEATVEKDAAGIAAMKKEGHTFTRATPEEEKLWYEASLPLHKEWVTRLEGNGLPAKAVYEEALRLAKVYVK